MIIGFVITLAAIFLVFYVVGWLTRCDIVRYMDEKDVEQALLELNIFWHDLPKSVRDHARNMAEVHPFCFTKRKASEVMIEAVVNHYAQREEKLKEWRDKLIGGHPVDKLLSDGDTL